MNPEALSALTIIRERMSRAKIVRSLAGQEESKAILDADKPSSIARSESEINEEQVLQIQEKVHKLRECVGTHQSQV